MKAETKQDLKPVKAEKLELDAINAPFSVESLNQGEKEQSKGDKTVNMFEPGKSLSITDIVSIPNAKEQTKALSNLLGKSTGKEIMEAAAAADKEIPE